MLRNKANLMMYSFAIMNKNNNKLAEITQLFLIDSSKYDEKISEILNLHEDELNYLKVIVMEQMLCLYYKNPYRKNYIIEVLEEDFVRNSKVFFENEFSEELEQIILNYYSILTNPRLLMKTDSYAYKARANNKFLNSVYDIFEMVIKYHKKADKEALDVADYLDDEEEGQLDGIHESMLENLNDEIISYIKFAYTNKNEQKKFIKEFILMCYATSKKENIGSKNTITAANYLDGLSDFELNIGYILNDSLKMAMMAEELFEIFIEKGINLNVAREVVTKESMNIYLNLAPDIYNEIVSLNRTMFFSNSVVFEIADLIYNNLPYEEDDYEKATLKIYKDILSGKIFYDSEKYCLNEPAKSVLRSQMIKYLSGKYVEYFINNAKKMNSNQRRIYNEILESSETDKMHQIFINDGEEIVKTYLRFLKIETPLIDEYRRNVYRKNKLDKMLEISPLFTGDYLDIIDCKNIETIRRFKKMVNIISEAIDERQSPYEYFNKISDYIIEPDKLLRSSLTILYENLICSSEADEDIIKLIEENEIESLVEMITNNPPLFDKIAYECLNYSQKISDIDEYLKIRKNKKISNKINVISKINPFYQEEKSKTY